MRLLLALLARVFHGKTLMEFPFNVPGSDMRCNIDSGNLPHVTCLVLLPPLRRKLSSAKGRHNTARCSRDASHRTRRQQLELFSRWR